MNNPQQIENIPLIMTDPSQIQYAVNNCGIGDAEAALPYGNLFRDFFLQKAAVVDGVVNNFDPVFHEGFTLFYPGYDIVLWRRHDNPVKMNYLYENGTRYIRYKCHPTHEPPIKNDTKLVFSKDTLMLTFNRKYDGDSPSTCSLDETRKRTISQLAIKQSVINCIRRRNPKLHIYMNGNDVLIEGSKLGGSESFTYDYHHHEHTMFAWYYDPDLFNKYLKNDANHINSLQKRGVILKSEEANGSPTGAYGGIIGVSNAIPGYTKQEFAEDMLKEMQYFLFMMA